MKKFQNQHYLTESLEREPHQSRYDKREAPRRIFEAAIPLQVVDSRVLQQLRRKQVEDLARPFTPRLTTLVATATLVDPLG